MKALLLIDIQNGFTKRKLHDFPLFVQTINHSIYTFREAKDLIVFVQHNNKQLKKSTEDWEMYDRIDKRDNWIILISEKIKKNESHSVCWLLWAMLQQSPKGLWYMQSEWVRTGKIMKD